VDTSLLLLQASSSILCHCVYYAGVDEIAYRVISQGLQHASSSSSSSTTATAAPPHVGAPVAGSSDDIVATLDSLLFLFHSLVSGGPWWQEAKANHPLLLVDALYFGTMVSQE
jgi:hypothetical protein